jgi:hypothetical protein
MVPPRTPVRLKGCFDRENRVRLHGAHSHPGQTRPTRKRSVGAAAAWRNNATRLGSSSASKAPHDGLGVQRGGKCPE